MQVNNYNSRPNISTSHKGFVREIFEVFSTLFFLLLILTGLLGVGIYYYAPDKYKEIVDVLLSKKNEIVTGNTKVEKKREFNQSNLSYFTDDELNKLGILNLPTGFSVQEIYKGINIVRSQSESFSDQQIFLLKIFIDRLPKKLLTPGPTAIVTFQKNEVNQKLNISSNTAAFASGTYIFFNDTSFDSSKPNVDNSVDAIYGTFLHELTHVSQFNEVVDSLTSKKIDEYYRKNMSWTDIVLNSNSIIDFASIAGWKPEVVNENITYVLDKTSPLVKTTDYGKTKIYEDMAESVSGVTRTAYHQFSDDRVTWVLKYLDTTKDQIEKNTLPIYKNAGAVSFASLTYDTSYEISYPQKYIYSDKQILLVDEKNQIKNISDYYAAELTKRGWTGKLKREVKSNNIIKYLGEFKGADRDFYLEIISYDEARGFVTKPTGTVIVIINGYGKAV